MITGVNPLMINKTIATGCVFWLHYLPRVTEKTKKTAVTPPPVQRYIPTFFVCPPHDPPRRPPRRYDGEMVVEYDSGEKTFVTLSASAGGVDVCLSTPSLQLEPAYIGLCSQKTLKIVNRSEIPVKFSWEAFATSEEEEVSARDTYTYVRTCRVYGVFVAHTYIHLHVCVCMCHRYLPYTFVLPCLSCLVVSFSIRRNEAGCTRRWPRCRASKRTPCSREPSSPPSNLAATRVTSPLLRLLLLLPERRGVREATGVAVARAQRRLQEQQQGVPPGAKMRRSLKLTGMKPTIILTRYQLRRTMHSIYCIS